MKTAHDLQQDAAEQERTDNMRVRELRNGLMRECPAGRFLDRDHLRTMLHQSPASNRPWLAWVYVAVHGATACGVLRSDITGDRPDMEQTLKRFVAHDVWWDPDPQRLASLPPEYRARLIGAR
jgi:hypothetical protein